MNNEIKYVSKEEYELYLKAIEEIKEKLQDENLTKEAKIITMKYLQEKVDNLKKLKVIDELEQEDTKDIRNIV